jgi:hypothetical protein
MIQDFMMWLALGAGFRVGAGWAAVRFAGHRVRVPPQLAGMVMMGAFLAKITWMLPVPLGLVLGLVLQDAILEKT